MSFRVFSIKEECNTRTVKMNIRIDIIAFIMFAVPLFMAVPKWYFTMEIVTGVVIVFFLTIGTVCLGFKLLSNTKKSLLDETIDEFYNKKFLTNDTIIGWLFEGFVLI